MEITDYKKNEILILNISGKLDLISSLDFRRKTAEFINVKNTKIILNFEAIDYISSAGIRELLYLNENIHKNKSILVICSINENIYRVFEITELLEEFIIKKNLEDALKYFAD